MKRKILGLLLLLSLFLPAISFAVPGTMVQSTPTRYKDVNGKYNKLTMTVTCTADSGTAAFVTTGGAVLTPATLNISGWYLESVETNPGTIGPTNLYDITILNSNGYDVAGALLTNRSISNTEKVYLAGVGQPIFHDTWTITITNNLVNSAVVVLTLTYVAE